MIAAQAPLADAALPELAVTSRRRSRREVAVWAASAWILVIVAACAAAPLYARYVAHTSVNVGNLAGSVVVDGRSVPVVSAASTAVSPSGVVRIIPGGQPIGPQWFAAGGRYALGADEQGRDVAVRLLYGGRLSLAIGAVAATVCISVSAVLALLAGYLGGWVDAVIGRVLDVVWSFPWILLSVAIGTSIAVGGFNHFGINLGAGSFVLITAMLTYGPVPYYARALRSKVLTLRDAEFVRAARLNGARAPRILLGELLPNVAALLPAMFALDFANVLLAESTLTYLGVGVQPPTASWGSMIAEGQALLMSAPWLTLLPTLCISATAISLNVVGERLRGHRRTGRRMVRAS